MHPPPFCWGRGVEPPPPDFQKGGSLAGPQFLEWVAGKEGGDFFQGVQFLDKKQTKIWNI